MPGARVCRRRLSTHAVPVLKLFLVWSRASQIMYRNQQSTPSRTVPTPGSMSLPEVLKITEDSFTSATERHIEVGDGLEMYVVRAQPATTAATGEAAAPAQGSAAIDLTTMGAVEASGGEDEQTDGAVMVIRRELKKD